MVYFQYATTHVLNVNWLNPFTPETFLFLALIYNRTRGVPMLNYNQAHLPST